jgi:ketosteroid isomerase-like protein
MSEKTTEAVVRAYIEACNGDDVDRVMSLLDRDVELHESATLPGAVSAVGLEAVRRYLERFNAHWSSFHWEPLEFRVSDDRAAVRARLRFVGRRSGVEVDREWAYFFTVRDGKLLRQDGFDEMSDAIRALEAGDEGGRPAE